VTRNGSRTPSFEPGLIPPSGGLLDWRDARHFAPWQTRPWALCEQPTPMRSHAGEPSHKSCAENWIAANPVEARRGRFASDVQSKRHREDNHA
jgi:hypothetical protein